MYMKLLDDTIISANDIHNATKDSSYIINLTIVITSCYSGGWVLNDDLPACILAVARWDNLSNSFARSNSGRYGGGFFTASIARALIEAPLNEPITYRSFTERITEDVKFFWQLGAH